MSTELWDLKGKRKADLESPRTTISTIRSTTSSEHTDGWQRTRGSVSQALSKVLPPAELLSHNVLDLAPSEAVEPLSIHNVALRTAVDQLLGIWDGVQEIEFNRLACLRLAERSAHILHAVLEEVREAGEEVADILAQPLEKLVQALSQFSELLAKLAHRPFLKRYLKRDETQRELEMCNILLTDTLSEFSLRLQLRVLQQLQRLEVGRQLDAEELSKRRTELPRFGLGIVDSPLQMKIPLTHPPNDSKDMPTVPGSLEDTAGDPEAADDTAILRAIVQKSDVENKLDLVNDAADLRAVMRRAITQDSDMEMLRILQLDREELPEAMKILQRAVEDAEVPPAYTPGAGPPDYVAYGLDQKLIVGVINALRRVNDGAGRRLEDKDAVRGVGIRLTNLPDSLPGLNHSSIVLEEEEEDYLWDPKLKQQVALLSDSFAASEASLPDPRLTEIRNERRYRLFLQHGFHPSLDLPLWNPVSLSVGEVGFLDRGSGTFVKLFHSFNPEKLLDINNGMPTVLAYGPLKTRDQREDKRTATQRGFDTLTSFLANRRTYTYPLQTGRKCAYLITETAKYRYAEDLNALKAWFKANIDSIIRHYGPLHQICREDVLLVVGTLDAPNYALFVNHQLQDGQVHFNVFASPKAGQPWGEFKLDTPDGGNIRPHSPLSASKVSIVGDPDSWKSVLAACLRFRPDASEPSTLMADGNPFLGAGPPPVLKHEPATPQPDSLTYAIDDLDLRTLPLSSRSHFPFIYPTTGSGPPRPNGLVVFRSADVEILDKTLAAGGVLVSVHSASDAAAWVEAHYNDPLLHALRARNFAGPLAIPLSPDESALAIFGAIADTCP
ncbi:hypothetical protein K438DRAFT_257130 [Mycena galopus ATCC 62051]|nr:hypothetical protein K438DRAFT_257130 [Mycena galopus ATCC 62051]